MRHVFASIDIGSDNVKIVVCELYKGRYNLLAASSTKSFGIRKGLIYDVVEAKKSIKKALDEIESMLGFKLRKVIAIIPAYNADFVRIEGKIEVDLKETGIDGNDVTNVLQAAIKTAIVPTKEMVTCMPIDFNTEAGLVKDPIGLNSSFLEVRAIMATTPKKNIYSVLNVLSELNIEVIDISLGCIGDIYAFKTSELDEKIGAIINIGDETTTVSLYNKGIIVKNNIINMGSSNVDSDIAYMYKISPDDARMLKENFAFAHKSGASVSEVKHVINNKNETILINQLEISEIVSSRIEEILESAKEEIGKTTNRQLDYIIVTGGITNLLNFSQIIRDIFGNCAIIGNVNLIGLRNNKFSSAIGNIIYFVNKLKLKGKDYTMINQDDIDLLSSPRKSSSETSNDSMLGKVFSYFFGE